MHLSEPCWDYPLLQVDVLHFLQPGKVRFSGREHLPAGIGQQVEQQPEQRWQVSPGAVLGQSLGSPRVVLGRSTNLCFRCRESSKRITNVEYGRSTNSTCDPCQHCQGRTGVVLGQR